MKTSPQAGASKNIVPVPNTSSPTTVTTSTKKRRGHRPNLRPSSGTQPPAVDIASGFCIAVAVNALAEDFEHSAHAHRPHQPRLRAMDYHTRPSIASQANVSSFSSEPVHEGWIESQNVEKEDLRTPKRELAAKIEDIDLDYLPAKAIRSRTESQAIKAEMDGEATLIYDIL